MEEGVSFDDALREAQAAGVAEADPRHDLEGWDAAVKACALANALMGADVRPGQVERRGILGLTPADVRRARAQGGRLRLIARAEFQGRRVRVTVAPETVPADDVLVSSGADGVVVLRTDLMREVGFWEGAGGVDQTAYALLSDLVAVAEARRAGARASARRAD
jgi:homoserine dehydrogenase